MLGGADEQGPAGRRGQSQAIGRPVAVCLAFPRDQGFDMGRVLDLRALVVAARMSGDGLQALDDAQPAGIGQHGQGASHMSMRHRVIVLVEADIRCLANLDGHPLDDGIGIVRLLQQ